MPWRVMPFETFSDPPGFVGWESLIERCRCMDVQVVLNQNDCIGVGEMNIAQLFEHPGIINGGDEGCIRFRRNNPVFA